MRITFTKHALRRLLERDISMSDVEAALSDPDEVVAVRHGRLAARRHDPSCFNVVVIYEVEGEVIIVVTAMKVSERGLGRLVSVEYDPSAPALYIRLRDGRVAGSEPLSDALILDLDEHGEIIGLEVLLPPDTPKEVVAKLEKIASKLSLGSGGA